MSFTLTTSVSTWIGCINSTDKAPLQTKNYDFLNPGIGPSPGVDHGACIDLLDPFGNTLRIDERAAG